MVSRRPPADARSEFARRAAGPGDPSTPVGDRDRKERAGSSAGPALLCPARAGWWKRARDLQPRASAEADGLRRYPARSNSPGRAAAIGPPPADRQFGKDKNRKRAVRATRAKSRRASICRGPVFPSRTPDRLRPRWERSFRRGRGERHGIDSVFERKVGDFDDEGIRRQAIGLDDNRARFFFRLVQ